MLDIGTPDLVGVMLSHLASDPNILCPLIFHGGDYGDSVIDYNHAIRRQPRTGQFVVAGFCHYLAERPAICPMTNPQPWDSIRRRKVADRSPNSRRMLMFHRWE
ncbi:hypothetical protein [Mesorhizobium sp. M0030]|uniref:hypothetical protein n=1 Tax=Mesorhizobium sp. M0030 TaxID=2956851 RepID=UPI0033352A95